MILVLVVTGSQLADVARRIQPGHILWFFLAVGFVALIVTILASRWPTYKLSWLSALYAALPSIRSLPFTWAQEGLQPNQTGGVLALCGAFAATVAIAPGVGRTYRWVSIFLTVTGFVGVFMTGSRAALVGLVGAVLLVLILRTRRWLWAWGAGVTVLGVGLLAFGQVTRIFHFFMHDETLYAKLGARLDIWSSALSGIQDHLLTGIGLGVFNQVMPVRYPYQTVGLSYPVSQAHNLLLDITLAIGLPGIAGFLLLLVGSLALAMKTLKRAQSVSHDGRNSADCLSSVVSMGILASFAAFMLFGLTDSISLSVPTSFIIWLWICSLAIVNCHSQSIPTASRSKTA